MFNPKVIVSIPLIRRIIVSGYGYTAAIFIDQNH